MKERPLFRPRMIHALIIAAAALRFDLRPTFPSDSSVQQTFVIEDVNDPLLAAMPPPLPVHVVKREFEVYSVPHVEWIDVGSKSLRNLSITLENRGKGLVRAPYLYGPHGWDFRSPARIAAAVADDPSLTTTEKFIRLHEWKGLHVATILGGSLDPYDDGDFSGNPLRVLNQYGTAMCGQGTDTLNALLVEVAPTGSMYGRKVRIDSHRTGEAFWDGVWHAYDTTPGTGIIQWIYYDLDNQTIAPSWKYLLAHQDLVTRISQWTGSSLKRYLPNATGEPFPVYTADRYVHWDFNYYLRPNESLTMYFDMRGRLDQMSARQDNTRMYRTFSDYASAVFTYRPVLTDGLYRKHAVAIENVVETPFGLVQKDPTKPASVVFAARSTWCFAGAQIKPTWKTSGKAYIAVNDDPLDLKYPTSPPWQLLSESRKEYSSPIEGKMVYWLKLSFEGAGSGLKGLEMASEVQMSPWSMPGLEYGLNELRLEAADLGGSPLRVTYRYDDKSPFHFYEPATSTYGRHVPVRIGGILQQGSKLEGFDYGKGRFWQRLNDSPARTVAAKVDLFAVSGPRSGERVRTLLNRKTAFGVYDLYWDGADDQGRRLPPGMYAYRLSIDGAVVHGERLYLYPEIWPHPNEMRKRDPQGEVSPADAVPRVAFVGDVVQFDVRVHRLEVDKIGVIWDFGDGGKGAGVSPKHAYASPGVFTACGSVIGPRGTLSESTVIVTILDRPAPPAEEQDPPAGEPAAPPPEPAPAVDSPMVAAPALESPIDAPAVQAVALPFDDGTLRGRVDLRAGHRRRAAPPDALLLRCILPSLPAGWTPEGQKVEVDVGGVSAVFFLDRKGRAKSPAGILRVKLKRRGGVFAGGRAPLDLRLRGDFANEWTDEGLEKDVDEPRQALHLEVRVQLDGTTYARDVPASLRVRR